ncbi:hypothetical protein ACH79_03070 [Bradyrhizobium sp. CCBAU 051011]|nr:hypothetical protein ACH79_03070 [Bradyrhizobium sp. CCBAU 051011]
MMFRTSASIVMAGLVTAFHVFGMMEKKDVDARDKPGHDASEERAVLAAGAPVAGISRVGRGRAQP